MKSFKNSSVIKHTNTSAMEAICDFVGTVNVLQTSKLQPGPRPKPEYIRTSQNYSLAKRISVPLADTKLE